MGPQLSMSPAVGDATPFGPTRTMVPQDSLTGSRAGGPAASPGMDPMAAHSLIAMLGGGVLDYIGQRQGAKAMQAEAQRQAA